MHDVKENSSWRKMIFPKNNKRTGFYVSLLFVDVPFSNEELPSEMPFLSYEGESEIRVRISAE